MIDPQAVSGRIGVANESVLVLELISQGCVRPSAFCVIALIIKSGAVDGRLRYERAVQKNEGREIAPAIRDIVPNRALQLVFETCQAVLPS